MQLEYNLWYVKRNDDGFITEISFRLYESEKQMINNIEVDVRTKMLDKSEVDFCKNIVQDASGRECFIYYSSDFGNIKTDEELILFMNNEIKKDKSRIPLYK